MAGTKVEAGEWGRDEHYLRLWHNGVWRVCWSEGRQTRSVSTRCRDRDEAVAWADRYVAHLVRPAAPADPTVTDILAAYLADCQAREIRGYEGTAYAAEAVRQHLGNLRPRDISAPVIARYTATRRRAGRSDGTIRKELVSVLRTALAQAVETEMIDRAPFIPAPAPPPPRDRWLTREECARFVAACREDHVRLFVQIALNTGQRRGAILELCWSQVDMGRRLIDFGRGNGRKRRGHPPINDHLFAVLTQAQEIATSDWVIEYRGVPVRDVKKGISAAARRAGVPATAHIFRHTAASTMAMDGVPLDEIADFLGADPATISRIYRKFVTGYQSRAAGALQLG